jgi:hypothetical protein
VAELHQRVLALEHHLEQTLYTKLKRGRLTMNAVTN